MKKTILLSSVVFLSTSLLANSSNTCKTVQLTSYSNSQTNKEIVYSNSYPESCKIMEIGSSIAVRCGCFDTFREANRALAELNDEYRDAFTTKTYRYRFTGSGKKNKVRAKSFVKGPTQEEILAKKLAESQAAANLAVKKELESQAAANLAMQKELETTLQTSAELEEKVTELNKKLEKMEKKSKRQQKKISQVNKLANKDNIKFDVDFRTAIDNIQYETATGETHGSDALFSNRLWLGMGYAPASTMLFKGQLSFNKAYGATAFNMDNGNPQRGYGFDAFDWVVNENLTDATLKVKEAYWLWMPKAGDYGFTVSAGRRPATNGYLINLRDDDKAKSPIGHVINMEFDGASASIQLDNWVSGMYAKLCLGRGLTNANARFTSSGLDYAFDETEDENGNSNLDTVDMLGIIFKPYDDGQYSMMTKWYRGFNVPGMYATNINGQTGIPSSYSMLSGGDMDGFAISGQMEGIGDEWSDFLDETILFASFAWSQTSPNESLNRTITGTPNGTVSQTSQSLLGSSEKESGTSFWLGAQMPNLTGGKFGLEYNHGSQYWRPFTYGEDTMIGSKMAVRGSAFETYWTQPLMGKMFSMQLRYTYLDYEYTGSNAFFGDAGTPYTMQEAVDRGMDPVNTAQDIRLYFRYRY